MAITANVDLGNDVSASSCYIIVPNARVIKNEDDSFTHTDTDISGETQEIQDVCAAVWTSAVKAAWKTKSESEIR